MKFVIFLVFVGLVIYFFDLPEEVGKLWVQLNDLRQDTAGRRMVFVMGIFATVPLVLIYLIFHFHP